MKLRTHLSLTIIPPILVLSSLPNLMGYSMCFINRHILFMQSVEERRTVVDSDGNEKVFCNNLMIEVSCYTMQTTVTYSDGRQKRETKKSRLWDRIL